MGILMSFTNKLPNTGLIVNCVLSAEARNVIGIPRDCRMKVLSIYLHFCSHKSLYRYRNRRRKLTPPSSPAARTSSAI